MATEQREKLHKVLEFYQYDQKDYPVAITLQERSEADLVMLEYIMTSNTYKDDVEGFISDMAHYEGWQSLEEWYKDTMEMEDEEEGIMHCCMDCDYELTDAQFCEGKGRVMFCADNGIGEGEYRCGVCDPRCSDPDGLFPDED